MTIFDFSHFDCLLPSGYSQIWVRCKRPGTCVVEVLVVSVTVVVVAVAVAVAAAVVAGCLYGFNGITL